MTTADLILIADMDISRVNTKLNRITQNTGRQANQAGRSFSKMSKGRRQEVRQLGFALQRMGIQGTAAFGEMFVAAGVAAQEPLAGLVPHADKAGLARWASQTGRISRRNPQKALESPSLPW